MTTPHRHESHPQIVNRLRRADGHLRGVIDMIEAGRSCLDIAQQLHAVERAIVEAKRALIQDHIDHCLDAAMAGVGDGPDHDHGARPDVADFKAIAKYL